MTMQVVSVAPNASGIRGIGPQADFFTLSGDASPGLATLTAVNAKQGWEIREAFALSWATIIPKGELLSVIEFEIELWTAIHSQAWDVFAAKYLARPAPAQPGTKLPKSFGFNHDQASAPPYNVSSVVILEVSYLGQRDGGKVAHKVTMLEWKQPLPAPPRPDQSTPPVEGGLPSAADKLDQELLDAAAQTNSLEAALTQ